MSEEKQREKQKAYEKYVKKITPVHNLPLNMLKAFLTGGLICVLGQLILNTASSTGADKETAGNWCSLLLIFISVILTGLNVYSKIGKFGGAGGLVPITAVSYTHLDVYKRQLLRYQEYLLPYALYLPVELLSVLESQVS